MTASQNFTAWLLAQRDRRDIVGHLAGDVACDPDWPRGARSPGPLRAYLGGHGAREGAEAALERAWAEYTDHRRGRDTRAPVEPHPIGLFCHVDEYQGRVVSLDEGGAWVQLFSWMDGAPTSVRRIPRDQAWTGWAFYADADAWRDAGDRRAFPDRKPLMSSNEYHRLMQGEA